MRASRKRYPRHGPKGQAILYARTVSGESVGIPSPRERFVALVRGPEEDIDLVAAALAIAEEEQPGLDPRSTFARLDEIALAVAASGAAAGGGELARLEGFLAFLYGELGFRGDEDDYYNPANSLFDQVLERRLGIPISLALVVREVAARVGIPLDGIGFPGHFLLRHSLHPQIFIDPFHGGRLLTLTDCREILARVSGGKLAFSPLYLRPAGARQILVRMLYNLREAYLRQKNFPRAIAAIDRIRLLVPDEPEFLRDRGLLCLEGGDPVQGIEDLESYLELAPESPEEEQLVERINEARRSLALVH